MMKKLTCLVFVLLLWPVFALAHAFSGQGIGPSAAEAKKEALADLAQNIHVEVVSEFSSTVTQAETEAHSLKTKHIEVASRLPILGVDVSVTPAGDAYEGKATLNRTSLPLYEKELAGVRTEIRTLLSKVDGAKGNAEKTALLQDVLTRQDRFERLALVARILGQGEVRGLDVTEAEVKSRIRRLEEKADTLDYGLKLMAKGFQQKGIYIFPPTTGSSREVTPFAAAVKDHLSVFLDTCSTVQKASWIMTGEYTLLDGAIELTYRLMDLNQNTVKTSVAWFLPSAYKGYKTLPATLDFERLIASGLVVSGDFTVDVKAEEGRSKLLYKRGETIRLLVKMNRPGYFYLMSHSFKEQPYSYLIHLNNTQGNRKFISYVGPDEAGKWVVLGEFESVPPFGVETLQVFASTEDLEESVPETFLDPETLLYKVGSAVQGEAVPAAALRATRGLMLKKKKASERSEASITITTMAQSR